ncbi:MAG: IcmL (DotI) protein [Alphaproteobacteria bacterium]|nr:IcmL (DotI) protein [Alphaproteobacteria bacterium]
MATPAKATPPKEGKKPSAGQPAGALEAVVTRNVYYRDGYRNLQRINWILSLAILALLIALAVTIYVSRPQDRFFATTSDGRLIRMIALDEPNMNDAALVSWSARAASDVMTFGFHDYQKRLQDASAYFTRRGWQSFTEALERSRVMEGVQQSQRVVTAAPKSAPTITQQGLVDGVYRWIVELPLIVTYQSGTATQTDTINVTLVIVRVSTLDSPSGVGIQQWVAR